MTDAEAEAYLLELAVMSDEQLNDELRKAGLSESEIEQVNRDAEDFAAKLAEAWKRGAS